MKNRIFAFLLALLIATAGLTMFQNDANAWHEDLGRPTATATP